MIRKLTTAALAVAIFLCTSLVAVAQPTIAPGHVWGNGTAVTRTPADAALGAVMDQALCATNDSVAYRIAGSWGCLGLLGTAHSWTGQQTFVAPILGAATGTSVALGGATIGANALAVTGTSLFNSGVTLSAALTYGGVTLSNAVTGTGAMVLATSPTLVTPALGTPASGVMTNVTGLPISTGVSGLGTGVATFLGTPSSANLAAAITDETGTGALVFATSPTFITPALGTPSSAILTNATGLPISTGVSGLASGIATFLGSPLSANLAAAITDETGSGALVFGTSPTIASPTITGGTHTALTLLGIRSSGTGAFDLTLANTENLTAGRILTLTVNNAARIIDLSGNLTLGAAFTTAGGNALTLTTAGITNVTLPTSGTLATTAATAFPNLVSIGTITTGTWNGTAIGIGFGGTGQTSAAAARGCSGLDIDCVTTFGNASYVALTTDRVVSTANSFTAQRTVTLPAVSAFNAGQTLVIVDAVGAINGANTLVIAAAGGDTINGLSSITISTQYSGAVLWPVGSNKWGYIASVGGAGTGTVTAITAGSGLSTGAGTSTISTSGTLSVVSLPQGRLTLVSQTPVMSSDQTAKSTIYYDCYNGNKISYFDGVADQTEAIAGCEVSTAMVSAASAGQVVSGQVYDAWWAHGGANRICIAMSASSGGGGGWASDTAGSNIARGTGFSQLDYTTRAYITNKNAIPNCFNGATNYGSLSANQATYLGTIYATANGQTGMAFRPSATAGGNNNILGLFNAYNQVPVIARSVDNTSLWAYTSTTIRAMDAGATGSGLNNRISWVDGLQRSAVAGTHLVHIQATGGASQPQIGIGLDSATTYAESQMALLFSTSNIPIASVPFAFSVAPQIGFHYVQALESLNVGSTTVNFYCTANGVATSTNNGNLCALSIQLQM